MTMSYSQMTGLYLYQHYMVDDDNDENLNGNGHIAVTCVDTI